MYLFSLHFFHTDTASPDGTSQPQTLKIETGSAILGKEDLGVGIFYLLSAFNCFDQIAAGHASRDSVGAIAWSAIVDIVITA